MSNDAVPCLSECHYGPNDNTRGVPEPFHAEGCPHAADRYIHSIEYPKVPDPVEG